MQKQAVVGEFDLKFEGDAVLAQRIVHQKTSIYGIRPCTDPYADEFIGHEVFSFVVAGAVRHPTGLRSGHPFEAAGNERRPEIQPHFHVYVDGRVGAEVFAHDGVLEDVPGFSDAAVDVLDVNGRSEVWFVHIDDGGDDLDRDGFAARSDADFGVGGVVG